MRQQVDVTLKITLDVDCTRLIGDIQQFIDSNIKVKSNNHFDLMQVKTLSIKEESEIYETE